MNWTQIQDTAHRVSKASRDLYKKSLPYVQKLKTYKDTAIIATRKQLEKTPLILKSIDEFEAFVVGRRSIVLGYDEIGTTPEDILMFAPVWVSLAWKDAAQFRLYSIKNTPDLATHIGVTSPVDMRVYFEGKEVYHAADLQSIKNWWDKRDYGDIHDTPPVSIESDPLKQQ